MTAPLTPATLQILLALAHGPRHGYGIRRDVEERTRGAIQLGAGTLYTALQRMSDSGWLEAVDPPPGQKADAGSRWRFYRMTRSGRVALEAELARLETDLRAARALLSRARS